MYCKQSNDHDYNFVVIRELIDELPFENKIVRHRQKFFLDVFVLPKYLIQKTKTFDIVFLIFMIHYLNNTINPLNKLFNFFDFIFRYNLYRRIKLIK